MTTISVEASARCPCGEPINIDDSIPEETLLVCQKCGEELGTYGDLNRQLIEAAESKVLAKIEGIFNR